MPANNRADANAQQKKWYQSHRKQQIAAVAKRKLEIRDWYRRLKATLSCACGEADPRCLDFHHRDPSTKKNLVSVLANVGSKRQLVIEIAKCDVHCANCHRKITHLLGP